MSPHDATFFEVMDVADYGITDSGSKATWPNLHQVRVPDTRWCNRARIAAISQMMLCLFVALSPGVKAFVSHTFNVGDHMQSVQQSAPAKDGPIFCRAFTDGHSSLYKLSVPYFGGSHSNGGVSRIWSQMLQQAGSMTPQQGVSMTTPQQGGSMTTPQQGGSMSDGKAHLNPPGD